MQEKQILKHTKQAVEQLTPDCFDAIWERAEKATPEEYPLPGENLPAKKGSSTVRRWIVGFSALAACILCFLGIRWYENYAVYTTINLDVNPSIRICINRQEEIVSMNGLNADGKKVVNALSSPTHRPLDEVVEEIVLELSEAGYFTADDANAILISVDAKNSSNAEALMESLSKQVSTTMGKKEVYGEVISQQMPRNDKEVERLAKELHISNGKATLIRNMTSNNGNFSEKDLADMKINEIVEKAEKERVDMSAFAQPARMHDVPPPKDAPKPSIVSDQKDSSVPVDTSTDVEISNPNKKENSTKGNSETKQDAANGSEKQPKATVVPKATEQPKTTDKPKTTGKPKDADRSKSDSNKKKTDSERQPNAQNEEEQSETNPDRGDVDVTQSPSVTVAPETTDSEKDRDRRQEEPKRPPRQRDPRHPPDEGKR